MRVWNTFKSFVLMMIAIRPCSVSLCEVYKRRSHRLWDVSTGTSYDNYFANDAITSQIMKIIISETSRSTILPTWKSFLRPMKCNIPILAASVSFFPSFCFLLLIVRSQVNFSSNCFRIVVNVSFSISFFIWV